MEGIPSRKTPMSEREGRQSRDGCQVVVSCDLKHKGHWSVTIWQARWPLRLGLCAPCSGGTSHPGTELGDEGPDLVKRMWLVL